MKSGIHLEQQADIISSSHPSILRVFKKLIISSKSLDDEQTLIQTDRPSPIVPQAFFSLLGLRLLEVQAGVEGVPGLGLLPVLPREPECGHIVRPGSLVIPLKT